MKFDPTARTPAWWAVRDALNGCSPWDLAEALTTMNFDGVTNTTMTNLAQAGYAVVPLPSLYGILENGPQTDRFADGHQTLSDLVLAGG